MVTWQRSRVMCAAVGAHQSPKPQPSQRAQTTNIKSARETPHVRLGTAKIKNIAPGPKITHLTNIPNNTYQKAPENPAGSSGNATAGAHQSSKNTPSRHLKQRIDPVASKCASQACPEISQMGGITANSVKMCLPSLS